MNTARTGSGTRLDRQSPLERCPDVAFVAGDDRPGGALLYRLLCLHPATTFISRLEDALPWLPAGLTGRLRLRRYSSKLRYWFRERDGGPRGRRALARQLMPAAGTVLNGHLGLSAAADCKHPPERVAARLRMRLQRLQDSADAHVVVCRCTTDEIPVLHRTFPQASYLRVIRAGADTTTAPGCCNGRGASLPEPHLRLLQVRYDDLVAEPIEQMRQVLAFLRLERRLDYEWALKALKLGQSSAPWRAPWAGNHGGGLAEDHATPTDRAKAKPLTTSGYSS